MAHVAWHAVTAIPFAASGHWDAAAMCVAVDWPWVVQELRFRQSGATSWHAWVKTPGALHVGCLQCYRFMHSFLTLGTLTLLYRMSGAWPQGRWIIIAWLVHLALDLPTHWGVLQQQPLWPVSRWKWPYVLRSIRDANE